MLSWVRSKLKREIQESEIPETPELKGLAFISLTAYATIPTKQFQSDAGYDLYSPNDVTILAGHSRLINTNIRVDLPEGYCGLVCGRSGLAFHHSILTHQGVIDQGYKGDIAILLFN